MEQKDEGWQRFDGPEVKVGDEIFILDGYNWELREKGDPLNVISFNSMDYENGEYTLSYNSIYKNIHPWATYGEECITLKFNDLVKTVPDGVAARFGIPRQSLPERDNLLVPSAERMVRRAQGILPVGHIGDERVFIDVRCNEIRSAELNLYISIKELPMNREGNKYFLFYDENNKQLYRPPDGLVEYPKNVRFITFPYELELDCYGFAQKLGADITSKEELDFYNSKWPLKDIIAGIFPLELSPMKQFIEENRKLKDVRKVNGEGRSNQNDHRKRGRKKGM